MEQTKQTGSAHAIIVIVLVLALLATLGVVFYQNFIAKKPVETTQEPQATTAPQVDTERLAFDNAIYAIDVPKTWIIAKESDTQGQSTIIAQNTDKTIRVKFSVSSGGVGGACDTSSPLKVRFYTVSSNPVTKLGDFKSYVVATMTDAEGGGYDYKIGLTQDGGETHAAVGDTHCTVVYVGLASRLVMNNDASTIVQPTIFATIDFPKLAAGTDLKVREMQQIKDMMALPGYNDAVKILESARKE